MDFVGTLGGVIRAVRILKDLCKSPRQAKIQLSVLSSRADACLMILDVCGEAIPKIDENRELLAPGVTQLAESVDKALDLVRKVNSMPRLLWKLRSMGLRVEMSNVAKELAENAGFLAASLSFLELKHKTRQQAPTGYGYGPKFGVGVGITEKKADLLAESFWRRHFGDSACTSLHNLMDAVSKDLGKPLQKPTTLDTYALEFGFDSGSDLEAIAITPQTIRQLFMPTLSMARYSLADKATDLSIVPEEDRLTESDISLVKTHRGALTRILEARKSFGPHADRLVVLVATLHRAKRYHLEMKLAVANAALDMEKIERLERKESAVVIQQDALDKLKKLRARHLATLNEAREAGLDDDDPAIQRILESVRSAEDQISSLNFKLGQGHAHGLEGGGVDLDLDLGLDLLLEERSVLTEKAAEAERLVLDAENALKMAQEAAKPSADMFFASCQNAFNKLSVSGSMPDVKVSELVHEIENSARGLLTGGTTTTTIGTSSSSTTGDSLNVSSLRMARLQHADLVSLNELDLDSDDEAPSASPVKVTAPIIPPPPRRCDWSGVASSSSGVRRRSPTGAKVDVDDAKRPSKAKARTKRIRLKRR